MPFFIFTYLCYYLSIYDFLIIMCIIDNTVSNEPEGASSWLTSLPLEKYGYVLNKQNFQDAICLRYNFKQMASWKVQLRNTEQSCQEHLNRVDPLDHTLICIMQERPARQIA